MSRRPPQARDDEAPDAVEILARRTGRFLGYVALFGLALYLLFAFGPR